MSDKDDDGTVITDIAPGAIDIEEWVTCYTDQVMGYLEQLDLINVPTHLQFELMLRLASSISATMLALAQSSDEEVIKICGQMSESIEKRVDALRVQFAQEEAEEATIQ